MNCIEIKQLNYILDKKKILNDLNLCIPKQQITGIIGGSGSGKTTLFRAILNLLDIGELTGTIYINGIEHRQINRKVIQPIFQDPILYFNHHWTLNQVLEEPLLIHYQLSTLEKREMIYKQLEQFSIQSNRLNDSITKFSGGELQRISLMRALLIKPEILIMDEPISALDVLIQIEVMELIQKLNEEKKLSIVFISHDIDAVHKICNSLFVMNQGEIVEHGKCKDVLLNPKHKYTKELLNSRDLSDIR